jgi:hypothetical protein
MAQSKPLTIAKQNLKEYREVLRVAGFLSDSKFKSGDSTLHDLLFLYEIRTDKTSIESLIRNTIKLKPDTLMSVERMSTFERLPKQYFYQCTPAFRACVLDLPLDIVRQSLTAADPNEVLPPVPTRTERDYPAITTELWSAHRDMVPEERRIAIDALFAEVQRERDQNNLLCVGSTKGKRKAPLPTGMNKRPNVSISMEIDG